MKANPMKTVPRDGQWIVILADLPAPVRKAKWNSSSQCWMSASGAQLREESLIGWIEDIEPPDPPMETIADVDFAFTKSGGLHIGGYAFEAEDIATIIEFLKQ